MAIFEAKTLCILSFKIFPQLIFEMTVNIIEYLFVWNNCAKEIELNCEYDMFLGVANHYLSFFVNFFGEFCFARVNTHNFV